MKHLIDRRTTTAWLAMLLLTAIALINKVDVSGSLAMVAMAIAAANAAETFKKKGVPNAKDDQA